MSQPEHTDFKSSHVYPASSTNTKRKILESKLSCQFCRWCMKQASMAPVVFLHHYVLTLRGKAKHVYIQTKRMWKIIALQHEKMDDLNCMLASVFH